MFRTMGEGTFVKPRSRVDSASPRRAVSLGIDVPLLLVVITLLIFGLVMVFSASYDYSLQWYGNSSTIFLRQLAWLGVGLAGAIFLTFFNYRFWQRLAVPAMGVTLVALLVVLIRNNVVNNAVRTLLGGSVQPSELAKFMIVIYLAVWLYAKRDQLADISIGLVPLSAILGALGGMIYLQPDLSAVITIMFLGGMLFFLGGGDKKQILLLVVVALVVGVLVVQVSSTGGQRMKDYVNGLHNPIDGSYHVRRSMEAFVKGGWVGVGIGRAETKVTGLPVPPTDSIFAVVGEETGVMGAAALVGLYTIFLWRGLLIARRAPDELGSLMAAGLALWLGIEAFINMAVMVNLLPFAGNALPFISAGGSNLVISMAAVGTLLNISRVSSQASKDEGRSYSAVVDLRRRDGGRGVSRPRRP